MSTAFVRKVNKMNDDKSVVVQLSLTDDSAIDERSYASYAESIIDPNGTGGNQFQKLTMTKLRNIYGLIMNIYSKINNSDDYDKYQADIQYLKVRMAYESGRDPEAIGKFLAETHLMLSIDHIESYEQFVLFCRYAESLLAYFVYHGGKE